MSFQEYLVEAGFARARRMMMGDVPHINSVGIMTAVNPGFPDEFKDMNNKDRNRHLWHHLRVANYGPAKMKGKFGRWEDSFLIPHITKDDIIELGRRYGQEVVIWGEKKIDDNRNPYFLFHWVEFDENGNFHIDPQKSRPVSVSSFEDIQNRKDFFSMIAGRKFAIPFDPEDPYHGAKPGEKYGTIKMPTPEEEDEIRKKIESFVPLFENPFFDVIPSHGPEVTYFRDKLPEDEKVTELVEEIDRRHERMLNTEHKSSWIARGGMQTAMHKLVDRLT